jgi:transposase
VSYNFIPYAQDQQYLLPPSLHEWVKEDSLERFVSDVVDHLDEAGELTAFYASYRTDGWGHPAYHPMMLLKVLLYGYAIGVRSSRKLATALERDIAFRYLAANLQPDHRTISDFRKNHREAFEELFKRIVELCREAGLAKMGRVAIDGRRVKGDAALDRNRTRKQIEQEIRQILDEAERIDAEEDEKYGPDRRGDELPEELRTREGRLRKLKEARARLDAEEQALKEAQAAKIEERKREERETGRKKRGRKPKPLDEIELDADRKVNLTDPESQILSTRKGWVQGYNGQIMVDCTSQVIVAQHVTNAATDVHQLGPLLEGCEEVNGARPSEVLADAGYWSEDNVEQEANENTELFIATTKDWKRRKELAELGPPRGRIPKDYGPKERMERKLRTKRGREIYKERSSNVEPVFGQMVMRGLGDFLLRGVDGAATEWSLFSGTHNLLKLWRAGWKPARMPVPTPVPA